MSVAVTRENVRAALANDDGSTADQERAEVIVIDSRLPAARTT
jgi:hypothetical protein